MKCAFYKTPKHTHKKTSHPNLTPKSFKKQRITLCKTTQIRNEENLGKTLCHCVQLLLSIDTTVVLKIIYKPEDTGYILKRMISKS